MQFIPEDHRFDQLEVHLWPPYPAQARLYEDDGRTQAYLEGHAALTRITAEGDQVNQTIACHPAQGIFAGQPETRRVSFVMHRRKPPQRVMIDEMPVDHWRFDPQAEGLWIACDCSVRRQTMISIMN